MNTNVFSGLDHCRTTITALISSQIRNCCVVLLMIFLLIAFIEIESIKSPVQRVWIPTEYSPTPAVSSRENELEIQVQMLSNRVQQLQEYAIGDPATLQDIKDCTENPIKGQVTSKGAFCVRKDDVVMGGNHMWSQTLAQNLCSLFHNQTVLDLGAGLGHYTRYLRDNNCINFGLAYDGGVSVHEATDGLVQRFDLTSTKKRNLGLFDWVLSLEVGEHIPAQYEQRLFENLDQHNAKGIVLSWAVVGQGGHHHVNNMNAETLIPKIEQLGANGYKFNQELSNKFRQDIEGAHCPWFKNTLYVFNKL